MTGHPVVRNRGQIHLGCDVDLRSNSHSTALGVISPVLLNTLCAESVIRIGDSVGISGAVICAKQCVQIGNRVLIGSGAVICDTDFHSLSHEVRGIGQDLDAAADAPVSIGDDCFIGARAMVLKGVTIGARSIVGAGAVVVKDVPADGVVAGNPACIVKRLNEQ